MHIKYTYICTIIFLKYAQLVDLYVYLDGS